MVLQLDSDWGRAEQSLHKVQLFKNQEVKCVWKIICIFETTLPLILNVELLVCVLNRSQLSPNSMEEQFFKVARELVSTVFNVATNASRKPVLRALAVSTFRACLDTLEMVLEQHKNEVKQFMDEALNGWLPFFIATIKEPLPPMPSEEDEATDAPGPQQWRGVIALKSQVVKVCTNKEHSNIRKEGC